ncbi:MAG: hypothetical protein IPN64_16545 [Propionivibrio sp.]|uniref:hypothetical protein n=1 Tax=Propionivibrio sp. TaxID=2212460 RepID=UPI0025E8444E|nr:hypothetical protein [Propionivibrio sp.]MBK8895570.1 hypothetical protein [Propionivibrio sp.]
MRGTIHAQLRPQGACDMRHEAVNQGGLLRIEIHRVFRAAKREKAVGSLVAHRNRNDGPIAMHRANRIVEKIRAHEFLAGDDGLKVECVSARQDLQPVGRPRGRSPNKVVQVIGRHSARGAEVIRGRGGAPRHQNGMMGTRGVAQFGQRCMPRLRIRHAVVETVDDAIEPVHTVSLNNP